MSDPIRTPPLTKSENQFLADYTESAMTPNHYQDFEVQSHTFDLRYLRFALELPYGRKTRYRLVVCHYLVG